MMNSYTKMAQAIDWMVAHATEHPSLETVAAWFNYEPTYFQKLFKDHVGVSPKKFLQYMTYRRARDLLLQGYSTLDAAYEAGLSGQGRLHDLFMNVESMTPGSVAAMASKITRPPPRHGPPRARCRVRRAGLRTAPAPRPRPSRRARVRGRS